MLKEGQEYTVCWLVEPTQEVPLVDFLIQLKGVSSELAATAMAHLKRARNPGNHGEPLTKAFTGKKMKGILEIRAKTAWGYIRMPFVYAKGQKIIVLTGVIKKSRSLEPKVENSIIKARDRLTNEEASYEEIDFSNFE